MMRRVKACTVSHRGYFEHLLHMYSFGYNSQIKYFGHMFIWTFFLVLVCGTHAESLSAPFSYILYTGCPRGKVDILEIHTTSHSK
jgi:hypothetical protein